MALTERLAILITADGKAASAAFQKVGKDAEKALGSAESRAQKMGLSLQRAGVSAVALGAVASVGLGKAAQKAGELEQAVGGTEAVFGEAASVVEQYAQSAAQSMGLSERAFREATTRIGGSLKGLGFETDVAAGKAVELTAVAADLAATYGGTTTDAVDALAAAFRGEADPAERFNLFLNQSRVNAKAVALGLAETTSAVSTNAKAQATLALILEQSADAQGQFARESDTLIGKQQIAAAEAENASAALGQGFVPIMEKAADAVTALSLKFADIDGATDGAASSMVAYGAVALTAAGSIAFVTGKVLELAAAYKTAAAAGGATSVLAAAGPITLTGAAIFGAAKAVDHFVNSARDASDEARALAKATDSEVVPAFQKLVGEFAVGRQDALDTFRTIAEENTTLARRIRDAMEDAGRPTEEYDRILKELGTTASTTSSPVGKLASDFKRFPPSARAAEDAVVDLADALAAYKEASERAASGPSVFDSLFGLADTRSSISEAFDSFNQSFEETGAAGGRAGRAVDLVAEKEKAVKSATEAATSAFRSFRNESENLAESQAAVADAQRALEKALRGSTLQDKEDAAKQVYDDRLALEDQTFAVADAEKALNEALAEGDPDRIARARNDLAQANRGLERAQRTVAESQTALNDAYARGSEQDPAVIQARNDLEAAQKRVRDATEQTADSYSAMNEAAKALDDTVNASLESFGDSDGSLANNRRNVDDTARSYLGLAAAIDQTIDALLAKNLTEAATVAQIDQIIEDILNNTRLSEDQRRNLLLLAYGRKAGAMRNPGYAGGGTVELASGGIVMARPGGTFANIGEGGRDEAVIPLPAGWKTSGFGGGSAVVLNNYGVIGSQQQMDEWLVESLARARRSGLAA